MNCVLIICWKVPKYKANMIKSGPNKHVRKLLVFMNLRIYNITVYFSILVLTNRNKNWLILRSIHRMLLTKLGFFSFFKERDDKWRGILYSPCNDFPFSFSTNIFHTLTCKDRWQYLLTLIQIPPYWQLIPLGETWLRDY